MGRQGSLRLQSDPSQGPNTSLASTGVTQTHYLDEIALEAPQSYSRPPAQPSMLFWWSSQSIAQPAWGLP